MRPVHTVPFLFMPQVWEFLRPRAPLITDVTFIILTVVYNLTAHTVVVSSIVTFNFFPVPSAVLSVEQVSPCPLSSHQSVCLEHLPICLSVCRPGMSVRYRKIGIISTGACSWIWSIACLQSEIDTGITSVYMVTGAFSCGY